MNHLDMVDSYLDGKALFEEFQREFIQEFYIDPMMQIAAGVMWRGVDDATKGQLKVMGPEAFKTWKLEATNEPMG